MSRPLPLGTIRDRNPSASSSVLKAVPGGWFSWDFRIFEGEREIALLDRAWVRERGHFRLAGGVFDLYRDGLLGPFVLETEGRVLARAEKLSALRRIFRVTAGERRYTLKAASPFRREFVLLQGERRVGSMRPESVLRRVAVAEFPEELPLPIRIFLVFLVLLLWKREASAAPAGG
ncbi:MAG: hypothetical protein ACE5JR_05910 [Gemmatimonadota bacterium]